MYALYELALTLIPKIGSQTAKNLIAHFGSAQAVFQATSKDLLHVNGIGKITASCITEGRDKALKKAEEELIWAEARAIKVVHQYDEGFPKRLKYCADAPLVLFSKGSTHMNATYILAVVGTRNITDYGKQMCRNFVEEISSLGNVLIVSGLAYGVDIAIHQACLNSNVPTLGVVAHGIDIMYPSIHTDIARRMCENGGVVTEFTRGTAPDRENFPQRNRIIAGMADATVVIEAGKSGGALITAEIAHSYSRDVFAYPGRGIDLYSEGCNNLIKYQKAQLITSAQDVVEAMNWDTRSSSKASVQKTLFVELSLEEQLLRDLLKEGEKSIDELCFILQIPQSQLSLLLLELEMKGFIKTLPGKQYRWLG